MTIPARTWHERSRLRLGMWPDCQTSIHWGHFGPGRSADVTTFAVSVRSVPLANYLSLSLNGLLTPHGASVVRVPDRQAGAVEMLEKRHCDSATGPQCLACVA